MGKKTRILPPKGALKPRDSTVKYDIFKSVDVKGSKKKGLAKLQNQPFTDKRQELLTELQQQREEERHLYRNSFFAFTKFCLGFDWLEPEVHGELCEELEQAYWGDKHIRNTHARHLDLLPRGCLKTTIETVSFPCWIFIQDDPLTTDETLAGEKREFRSFNGKAGYNQTILINSETEDNARRFMRSIKDQLLMNEKLQEVFGDLAPKNRSGLLWTQKEANVTWRSDYGPKEANLTVGSADKSLNSGHYDIILNDDVISEKTITTPEQLQKSIEFYENQLPFLNPTALHRFVGTRWHDADLYGHLIDQGWPTLIESAERSEEEIESGKRRFFFPQQLGEEKLAHLKATIRPELYSCNYQNEPLAGEDRLFKGEFFDNSYYDYRTMSDQSFMAWKNSLTIFTTCDPAISKEKTACHAAIITCGWDAKGVCWVLDLFRRKGVNPGEFIDEIFRQYQEWRPIMVGVEEEGFQKIYRHWTDYKSKELGVWIPWSPPLKPDGRSKSHRIAGLEPFARARRIKMLREHTALETEFVRFPKGKYKDAIDAMAYQLDLHFIPGNLLADEEPTATFRDLQIEEYRKEYAKRKRALTQGTVRDYEDAVDWSVY